jgi:hypothetical protein
MADTRHTAVVASLKATASELHARPWPENGNEDWADLMAANLAAAGLLAAPAQLQANSQQTPKLEQTDLDMRRITAEMATGLAEIAELVGLDRETDEPELVVNRVRERLVAPAVRPASPVVMPQSVSERHTGKRVRYAYDGDTWDGWLITITPTALGTQATVKRDDGEDWVVMAKNCALIDSPSAAPADDEAVEHVIEFRARGWTIKHPLSCRPALFDCPVNRAVEDQLAGPPATLGRYIVDLQDGELVVGEPADEATRGAVEASDG